MRIHVLLGQGGYLFSSGFAAFGNRLRGEFPDANVQTWTPHDWPKVVEDVHQNSGPYVLTGYSLGGNAVSWAGPHLEKDISLAAIYDATVNGPCNEFGERFKRVLCFVNTLPDLFGKAICQGKTVEVTAVAIPHLFMQGSEYLHQMTIAAIKEVQDAH